MIRNIPPELANFFWWSAEIVFGKSHFDGFFFDRLAKQIIIYNVSYYFEDYDLEDIGYNYI